MAWANSLAAGLALGLFGAIADAQAHAVLVWSQPGQDGATDAGGFQVRLRFDSRIDALRSRLTLKGPDGTSSPMVPQAGDGPAEITARVPAVPPGAYVLRWQVLAIDGHVSRGELSFTAVPR
jgi:copper resistance protein C